MPNPALLEMEKDFVVINGEQVKLPPRAMDRFDKTNIANWGMDAVMYQKPKDKGGFYDEDRVKSWEKYVDLRPMLLQQFDGWWMAVHWNDTSPFSLFYSEAQAWTYARQKTKQSKMGGFYVDCLGREITMRIIFTGLACG